MIITTTAFEDFMKNSSNVHPALDVYNFWQKDYHRGWKWNNLHRHVKCNESFATVPIHDDRIRNVYRKVSGLKRGLNDDVLTEFNKLRVEKLTGEEFYGALQILKNVRLRRKGKEINRKRRVRCWMRSNVCGDRHDAFLQYIDYRVSAYLHDQGSKGTWFDHAVELGMTYKHLRNWGYVPYCDYAEDLEDEFDTIDILADELSGGEVFGQFKAEFVSDPFGVSWVEEDCSYVKCINKSLPIVGMYMERKFAL